MKVRQINQVHKETERAVLATVETGQFCNIQIWIPKKCIEDAEGVQLVKQWFFEKQLGICIKGLG